MGLDIKFHYNKGYQQLQFSSASKHKITMWSSDIRDNQTLWLSTYFQLNHFRLDRKEWADLLPYIKQWLTKGTFNLVTFFNVSREKKSIVYIDPQTNSMCFAVVDNDAPFKLTAEEISNLLPTIEHWSQTGELKEQTTNG